jgi:hypothetical protein
MALNLWKLGGKPTSYNPLPIGTNYIDLGLREYKLTLKAKSPSNGRLRTLKHSNVLSLYQLSNEWKIIEETFSLIGESLPRLYLSDVDSKGDIIIEDIQLVQKPLPNAVQLNKRPKRYVPKKNLIPTDLGNWLQGTGSAVTPTADSTRIRSKNDYVVTPNKTYSLSVRDGFEIFAFFIQTYNTGTSSANTGWGRNITFTTASDINALRIVVKKLDGSAIIPNDILVALPQLEEGTSSTPYEPYTEVLPRAKQGLMFNGVSDYLQLPSMTMDSIEIDCLIDSVQPNVDHILVDTRTGGSGYVGKSANVVGFTSMLVDGVSKTTWNDIVKGQRTKIKVNASSPFTDDVTIFTRYAGDSTYRLNATLYSVKCFLNGSIVAQYDFTNPSNIVGDKVLQKAQNLIPSFEDSRWSLHSNFKVLGKDVGRLDATSGQNASLFIVDVIIGKTYRFYCSGIGELRVYENDNFSTFFKGATLKNDTQYIEWTSTTGKAYLRLTNITTGSFDFIKPQLYMLDGKEGAIVGVPTKLRKQSKRTLFRKR